MWKTLTLFSIVVLLILSETFNRAYANNHEPAINIYIRDDVYEDYQSFVNDRDVLSITSFSGSTIRRDVVDMIIAQQALSLGGFKYKFKYSPGKVNFRNTKMLQTGELLISFDSYWLSDATALSEKLYISDTLIRNGEYVAGIYTSPKNAKALAVTSLSDLETLTAVSTPKWRTDWATLQALNLKDLVREDEWLGMARMVDLQWIDFLLMPFHSSSDRSYTMQNIHLVPVEGVAIVLNDSRHFVVSKQHKHGQEAIKALNKGLKILRKNKSIEKAYTEAGFFINDPNIKILNRNSP